MCGISGIVGGGWSRGQLEAMVASQNHRGPDDSGIYVNPPEAGRLGGVGLGHNRLSIIDLSAAGRQPMSNQDGTAWIVFNGEVYNYRELRSEIGDYPYRSHTDTEVILAAYERWGERCVDHFIGMFAFAIWDSRVRALYCARDRLGIKPFHYAWHGDRFLFASEIKAILAAGFPPKPNWSVWATYLTHGYYDHGDETFFSGVNVLPPGHTLTLSAPSGPDQGRPGRLSINQYWDLPALAAEELDMDDDAAASMFTELFDDAVSLRLRSDVPLGVNLSGGLDSAGLMVTVDRLLKDEGGVHTFTASYADRTYDEREFADDVPRHTHWIRHIQRMDDADVWDIAEEVVWHQEAPFGGIATLGYHYLHSLARQRRVKVLLEGQGADEMLAGYRYFKPYYYLDLLQISGSGGLRTLRRELRASASGATVDHQSLDAVRRLRAGHPLLAYQDGTAHLSPGALSPEVSALAKDGTVAELSALGGPFPDHLRNVLYRDLRYTKLPRVLRMNDRLSMAFSRELREPYLDHRIVEFLFRLPGEQKIRHGKGKFLLRHAMADRLPDSVRLASKREVVTPQREWLGGVLRARVQDLIGSRPFAERGIFDAKEVETAYSRFCAGDDQNAFFVWQWVNTEMWFRMFIDEGGNGLQRGVEPTQLGAAPLDVRRVEHGGRAT